ncbi:hypothetical protein BY458DRAFT_505582 [Sporodiniella umbellata]|nr:hypothetical protein BY458DRAFT_505582 [Sporodiniella umbellata]
MTDITFFCLTPEPDKTYYMEEETDDAWMEDYECQENTFQIVPLSPEESVVDQDNHIRYQYHYFFKELGYFTEEPEPIDPKRNYEQEAHSLITQRNQKLRQQHIELSSNSS